MVTIQGAAIYSMKGEMAFELTYSEGTTIRAVQSRGGWIRNEYKDRAGEWKPSGKPYVVKKNKKRQGERTIQAARAFLN